MKKVIYTVCTLLILFSVLFLKQNYSENLDVQAKDVKKIVLLKENIVSKHQLKEETTFKNQVFEVLSKGYEEKIVDSQHILMESKSQEEIKLELKNIDEEIDGNRLIEKANKNELTEDELKRFDHLILYRDTYYQILMEKILKIYDEKT